VKATRFTDYDEFEQGPKGAYMLEANKKALMLKCPKCGQKSSLPLNDSTDARRPGWKLENEDPITISPSIHHDVTSCGYHGFLKDGTFTNTGE